jgi:hypothetical protein
MSSTGAGGLKRSLVGGAKQGGAILTYRGPTVDVESWWSGSSLVSGKAQGRWRMDVVHRGTC